MNTNHSRWAIGVFLALLMAVVSPQAVYAQDDGLEEPFDILPGEGWELAPGVMVEDGVLILTPGNFALRGGDWDNFTTTIRIQFSGPGVFLVHYAFQDTSHYILHIADDVVLLTRVMGGEPSPLGEAAPGALSAGDWLDLEIRVQDGQHAINVNGTTLITAVDDNPLPPGGLLFVAEGERSARIDSLEIRPGMSEGLPPEDNIGPGEEPDPALSEIPNEQNVGQEAAQQASWFDALFDINASNIDMTTLVINLLLAAVAAYILSRVYIHWGSSLSNRRKFAANFMLITVTTTFIILVVRASIALSLGLVGALSIVRFRTAIKEPEELAYLFFAIGIGIGLGDNQRLITLIALAVGILLIALTRIFRKRDADVNLHVTVTSYAPHKIDLEAVLQALHPHTAGLKLVRMNENGNVLETAFLAEFRNASQISDAREALNRLAPQLEIAFLDNQGMW